MYAAAATNVMTAGRKMKKGESGCLDEKRKRIKEKASSVQRCQETTIAYCVQCKQQGRGGWPGWWVWSAAGWPRS
jgi:hypothetical protein